MRPSLLDGLLATLRRNRGQGRPGMAVLEVGRIYRPADDALGTDLDRLLDDAWRWSGPDGLALPLQPRTLGLAAFGVQHGADWIDEGRTWDVTDVLAAFDEVARRVGAGALAREHVVRDGWHPGRTVRLLLEGVEVGMAGQLHPHEADHWDLPDPVVAGELIIEALLRRLPHDGAAPASAPIMVRHPAVVVDVAVVAEESVSIAELSATVRTAAGALLDELWWFDEFRGTQLPDGHRSVAFRLRLQAPDRQLNDTDADGVLSAVEQAVVAAGASLRR
jgi:phenylalanyl-tRNA synthetase beta chain